MSFVMCLLLLMIRFVLADDKTDGCSNSGADDCQLAETDLTKDEIDLHDMQQVAQGTDSSRQKRSILKKLFRNRTDDVYDNKILRWDPHYIRLHDGDTLRLDCCMKMPPDPDEEGQFLWWHNDISINLLDKRITSHFPVLVVKNVSRRDNGVYWTRRKELTKTMVYSVTVYSNEPVIRRRVGESLSFRCNSRPIYRLWGEVKFTWFHNGSAYQYTVHESRSDYKLVLTHLDYRMSGRWQCVALVRATLTCWMTNEGVFRIYPARPEWHDLYLDVEKLIGMKIFMLAGALLLCYFVFRCAVFQGKKVLCRLITKKAHKEYKQKARINKWRRPWTRLG